MHDVRKDNCDYSIIKAFREKYILEDLTTIQVVLVDLCFTQVTLTQSVSHPKHMIFASYSL